MLVCHHFVKHFTGMCWVVYRSVDWIGYSIEEDLEQVLKSPAQALVYDDEGLVDVEESEHGVEQIYEAGKALQEAIEYPRKSGGMHLRPVNERAKGLTTLASGFCKALAQIIVTVMEQFKTEVRVVAGSDYGKVSKSDTHAVIARMIRDTQRKFQSALLGDPTCSRGERIPLYASLRDYLSH